LEAVRKQVELTTGATEITHELLSHLLRRQCLLVIVDHYSELSPGTRERIQPGHDPKLAINAMIVTSRHEEQLQGAVTDKVKPHRIQGNRLSSFSELDQPPRVRHSLEMGSNCLPWPERFLAFPSAIWRSPTPDI
jgi:hypothetical protein